MLAPSPASRSITLARRRSSSSWKPKTYGDTLAEVNRGLNCIKGYFLSKIMYGGDRLTTPLLRKKDGAFDKNGELTPVTWDETFEVMASRQSRAEGQGPDRTRHVRLRAMDGFEGYATKLMRAGFRSNKLDPNARHCIASAAVMRTFGMDEPMGCYEGSSRSYKRHSRAPAVLNLDLVNDIVSYQDGAIQGRHNA